MRFSRILPKSRWMIEHPYLVNMPQLILLTYLFVVRDRPMFYQVRKWKTKRMNHLPIILVLSEGDIKPNEIIKSKTQKLNSRLQSLYRAIIFIRYTQNPQRRWSYSAGQHRLDCIQISLDHQILWNGHSVHAIRKAVEYISTSSTGLGGRIVYLFQRRQCLFFRINLCCNFFLHNSIFALERLYKLDTRIRQLLGKEWNRIRNSIVQSTLRRGKRRDHIQGSKTIVQIARRHWIG